MKIKKIRTVESPVSMITVVYLPVLHLRRVIKDKLGIIFTLFPIETYGKISLEPSQ